MSKATLAAPVKGESKVSACVLVNRIRPSAPVVVRLLLCS